ncbi:MAG: sn-glycerol-1-phosphate dehydrogenase [Eubacteriaceae bacterium]|nr:sn-glycerol-1-phosphate dehydrogenase [Eubacteriaceae bacterium]
MNEILNLELNDMAQTEFDCSCGRHHNFTIHDIAIGKGTISQLPKMAAPFKDGKILMVFDNNTYKAAGEQAVNLMKDAGFNVKELLFDRGTDILIPDESVVGRILQEQDMDTSLMIAVGSGSVNDSVKYVSSRTKVPYIIVGTAPSMDGYVSDGAPLMCNGYKISFPAKLAYGVIGDTDIMKKAPMDLIQAGFGDVVGKITALADWDLAVKVKGDYRCDTCVTLVQRALDECFAKAPGLKTRDDDATQALIEALTMTGVAMGLINISRPASGAEHMLSHYWEMDYVARGVNPIHHGLQVGVATPIIAEFFEEMADLLPEGTGELCPKRTEIEALLASAGAPVSPKDVGISKDLFYNSLLKGYTVRPRYSVMEYAKEKGRLDAIAQKITNRVYA